MTQDGPPLHVVATAGHVDHGKSALILRLTGMDPDRLPEEKRRGLTIDLGFAWTALPSGREVGFVDVPGHERFVRNMLAGVGPVRLVLFVVAADEGWKPQSEEHLQIVDVLGAAGAVVAVTKKDLVSPDELGARVAETAERLHGTRLASAPILPCSAVTGEGVPDVTAALDAMLEAAPPPQRDGRPRQYLDRVFTIRGAGTVVTGTLTGGPISVGQEAEIVPSGHRARIRGLQTHKRSLQVARPVSRVAVNLAGTPRTELERGDVLTLPGQWRPTAAFEGWIRPVRGIGRALTARGAYKLYVGSAERDATIRLQGATQVAAGEQAFVRVRLSRPVVLDFGDPFVLREVGRQETVAGGEVLDPHPPPGRDSDPEARLRQRVGADRATLARLLVEERGAVRSLDVPVLAGVPAEMAVGAGATALEGWVASPALLTRARDALLERLGSHHAEHPLRGGLDVGEARALLADLHPALSDAGLADAVLADLAARGAVVREGNALRLPGYRLSTVGRADAERLVDRVRAAEPTPPSVRELMASGFGPELIRATCAEGRLVRIAPDLVVSPEFLARAEEVVRERGRGGGFTVSAFREALGTSRKYALPILEYFDSSGLTRRQGDLRTVRG